MTADEARGAGAGAGAGEERNVVLKPLSHPELGEILIDDDLFAIGRNEPPFASYDALLERAGALVDALPPDEQVVVVNAHPRIGESAAVVRQTSALSYREQGYEDEAGMAPQELERVYAELARLNAAYEAKHGFRFVVFVNGRPKAAILEVLRERIANPREQELRTALREMLAIARDRFGKLHEQAS